MHSPICLKTALPLPPIFEHRPEEVGEWALGTLGGNKNCKSPDVGGCWVCSRSSVTRAGCWVRVVGDEAGEVVGGWPCGFLKAIIRAWLYREWRRGGVTQGFLSRAATRSYFKITFLGLLCGSKVVGVCPWTLDTDCWSATDHVKTSIYSSLLTFKPADMMITKGCGCHLHGGWRWGGEWCWV